MNRIEMNQIIFNALETERSHTKNREYSNQVEEAMKKFKAVNKTNGEPRGICKDCGSQDIGIPCSE